MRLAGPTAPPLDRYRRSLGWARALLHSDEIGKAGRHLGDAADAARAAGRPDLAAEAVLAIEDEGAARSAWMVIRWPLGIALAAAGLAVLFNWSPRRRQPGWPWLAFGAWVSVAGWTLVTAVLALVFNVSKTFGQTYGSLAGLVALQLWTFFSALAILYGVAVAAQLEAVRAGVPEAQDLSKDEMTVAEPVSV